MEVMVADLLLQYREAVARGHAVVAGLDHAQFNWRPAPDAWSIGECLEHLNRSNEHLLANMRNPMRKARTLGSYASRPFELGWIAKKFVSSLEPPAERRAKAPQKLRPPAEVMLDECLRAWVRTHEELARTVQASEGLDWTKISVRSSAVWWVRYSLGTAFNVAAAHDRRHLWQAENVRDAEDFPGDSTRAEG